MSSKLGVFSLCSVGAFDRTGGGKVNSLKALPCPGFSQNSYYLFYRLRFSLSFLVNHGFYLIVK